MKLVSNNAVGSFLGGVIGYYVTRNKSVTKNIAFILLGIISGALIESNIRHKISLSKMKKEIKGDE